MESWFLKREYRGKLIESEIKNLPPVKKSRKNNKSKHLFIKYE